MNQFLVKPALFLSLFLSVFVLPVFGAVFDISYTLTEGGYRLELTPNASFKGVRLEVDSDLAQQYEIVQTVVKPLENRDNPGITLRDNLVYRALVGSNKFGSLRIPASDIPVRSGEVLYTSNATGNADSFTLVFGLLRAEDITPGYYFGRLAFTLNPVGSGGAQVTKILEISVKVEEEGRGQPMIKVSTIGGSRKIVLSSKKTGRQSEDVVFELGGTFKRLFSITQTLTSTLESQDANRLDNEAVSLLVKDVTKGMGINQLTPVSSRVQTLYTSGPNGQCDPYFVVTYSLGDLSKQKAGFYRSSMQYFLEDMGSQVRLETIQFEIENERIFDLVVTPQGQSYTIEFRDLKPTSLPQRNEVTLEVKTNIGKQYQVIQDIRSDLLNAQGEAIPAKYFTLLTEPENTKGALKASVKQEVKKGSTVLFVSDTRGSADTFRVVYELACPPSSPAGNYETNVTYSLIEI